VSILYWALELSLCRLTGRFGALLILCWKFKWFWALPIFSFCESTLANFGFGSQGLGVVLGFDLIHCVMHEILISLILGSLWLGCVGIEINLRFSSVIVYGFIYSFLLYYMFDTVLISNLARVINNISGNFLMITSLIVLFNEFVYNTVLLILFSSINLFDIVNDLISNSSTNLRILPLKGVL